MESESTTSTLKGDFNIIVTAENARSINQPVTISSADKNGTGNIIAFSDCQSQQKLKISGSNSHT
jgi:hypothetical protein